MNPVDLIVRAVVSFVLMPAVAAGSQSSDGMWIGIAPPGHWGHAAVYDSVRGRMLVYGGYGAVSTEIWTMSLEDPIRWVVLHPAGPAPGPRMYHSAVYDALRDRMLVFGGWDLKSGRKLNDVWALSLSATPTWSELRPKGPAPRPRWRQSATYDPVRDRLIVFGGLAGEPVGELLNDVWALNLTGSAMEWNELAPAGPAPMGRSGHAAVYDPSLDRMIVIGGEISSRGELSDRVWVLSLTEPMAWGELAPAGLAPAARCDHSVIYDPTGRRVVVFGGERRGVPPGTFGDLWVLSLSGAPEWQPLKPEGPTPKARSRHTAIFDAARRRMVVFGGFSGLGEAWSLSLAGGVAWTALYPAPNPVSGGSAIYDPVRDQVLTFGGRGDDLEVSNEVWACSLSGAPTWRRLAPIGKPPPGRMGHTAVYVAARDRMIVFGGFAEGRVNDVWALDLSGVPEWLELHPAGSAPVGRSDHTAIYDPVGDCMVVFGGMKSGDPKPLNDTWILSLSGTPAWSKLPFVAGPPPKTRSDHSAIYDPVRRRMLVFGGDQEIFGSPLDDVWELALSENRRWRKLATRGERPSRRFGHQAVYDSARDRMVIFGGWNGWSVPGAYPSQAWALSLSGKPSWKRLDTEGHGPEGREDHTMIYDPLRGRTLVLGPDCDVWALEARDGPEPAK